MLDLVLFRQQDFLNDGLLGQHLSTPLDHIALSNIGEHNSWSPLLNQFTFCREYMLLFLQSENWTHL